MFVWAVIFSFFGVPREFQFRVLFWGIFGALVLRGIFIFAGVSLIETFDWILYVFGAFLLYTAVKIARHDESEEVDHEASLVMRAVRRFVPTTPRYDGQKLFTIENGRRLATPLFAVLILIEATDVLFAVDSVPAILAISREPFIVFASNAFAILGLRALYFLVGGMQGRFRYLNIGLGVILAFVGVKMLLIGEPFEVPLPHRRITRCHRRRADRDHRRLVAGRRTRRGRAGGSVVALVTARSAVEHDTPEPATVRVAPMPRDIAWRREWDLNPRRPEGLNGFRDRPIRPLWHPSWGGDTSEGSTGLPERRAGPCDTRAGQVRRWRHGGMPTPGG